MKVIENWGLFLIDRRKDRGRRCSRKSANADEIVSASIHCTQLWPRATWAKRGNFLMRKVMTFLAVAAVVTDLAVPVYAADSLSGGMFNATTPLGWRQTNRAAAMAYFHMPLAGGKEAGVPRVGLMIAGPSAHSPGEAATHFDGARMVDLSFSHGAMGPSWSSDRWSTTFAVNDTVAWSNNSAIPADARYLSMSAVTWVAVGAISVGLIAGGFALTNRKKPGS
jgi:hypothetical protein